MNDIQVADAGTQNYALDKCAMPADFGNREISGHLAVVGRSGPPHGEERVFARLEP
jgi:hypothetical protein